MPATLSVDTVLIGRYRITDVIAEGGMGVVYRAEDDRLRRPVAVKTVGRDDPELLLRLRREARLLAQVSHPNVVRLYDVAEHEGQYCLISELVEGTPLSRLRGRLTTPQIGAVAEQIAGALGAAHARGIVHRDLKPSNVIVGDRVRLLDFGIARHIDDSTITTTEGILGTASYLAPEQLDGHPAGPPADVYALGLVLIELFTGRPAFAGTFAETVTARLLGPPELPESIPGSWRAVIGTMVARDPAQRPTAPDLEARLRRLQAGLADDLDDAAEAMVAPAASRPPTAPPVIAPGAAHANRAARRRAVRHRTATPAATAAVAALAVVGVAGFTLTHRGGAAPDPGDVAALTAVTSAEAAPAPTTTIVPPAAGGSPVVAVTTPAGPEPQADTPEVEAVPLALAAPAVAAPAVTPSGDPSPSPVRNSPTPSATPVTAPASPTPTTTSAPPPTTVDGTDDTGGATEPVQDLLQNVDRIVDPLLP